MARKKKDEKSAERFTREEFESFQGLNSYDRSRLRQAEPSCFNGCVRVERYRWTVERIEESPEVLYARLLDMWETCDNYHHWGPLKATALRLTEQDRLGAHLEEDQCL